MTFISCWKGGAGTSKWKECGGRKCLVERNKKSLMVVDREYKIKSVELQGRYFKQAVCVIIIEGDN